ncbi:MAG: geranylgeranyl reductase family protein [Betaproteobacteria bacterium]
MVEQVDVLCVGLGPAGASAAAEAARRGLRVVAVDRRREAGRPVQCAEFVPALIGVEVGHLGPAVRQAIAAMVTFVESDAPDVQPDFRGTMLDRARFDALLVERAVAAGATCRFGATVRDVAGDGRVTLSNGDVARPRVLIGADGPRSIVGEAIGSRNVALVETRQVTAPLVAAHEATDIFLSDAIPGGYGWLFPKGDVANIGAGVVPRARAELKPIVERLHRSLVEAGRVGRQVLALTGGLIPVGGMVAPRGVLATTQVLLAGDAAGLANPVTGAGIAAAVYSGKLAGEAASAVIAGDANAADDYADELETVFGASLARALRRRQELAADAGRPRARHAALRRGWIAYPEYWAA